MPEPMDIGFSVFNGHVNQADTRARALMRAIAPAFLAEVEAAEQEGDGIMAIFQKPPTIAVMLYAGMVAAYVNEGRALSSTEPIKGDGNAGLTT